VSNACIEQGLIIAALAALIGGCAGPSVMVEDRSAPDVDRPKAIILKAAGGPKGSAGKNPAAAQSPCGGHASNLIHPLHFDTGTANGNGQCPLLFWEVRTVREDPQSSR
jgi:hypothetical protein